MNNSYVYVYCDPRKPGRWEFKGFIFNFQPFYIGRGKQNRIKHHLSKSSLKKDTEKNKIIKEIIEQTGNPPIYFKIYENLEFKVSEDEEKALIKHFGRLDLGTGILTNMTHGGEAAIRHPKCYEHAKGANSFFSKRVDQHTRDGEFIQTWEFILDATRTLGIASGCISACCKGNQKSAGGYIWCYSKFQREKKPARVKKPGKKPVFKYAMEGPFIRNYTSITEAEETEDFGEECLWRVLNSGKSIYKSFQWFLTYQGETVPPQEEIPPRTPYKGVYLELDNGRWFAKFKNNELSRRKVFKTEVDAAEAFDQLSLYINPNEYDLNFPEKRDAYLSLDLKQIYERFFIQRNTSKFKGISPASKEDHWEIVQNHAIRKLSPRSFSFGSFFDEIYAAELADKFRYFVYGRPLKDLNFPEKLQDATEQDKINFIEKYSVLK